MVLNSNSVLIEDCQVSIQVSIKIPCPRILQKWLSCLCSQKLQFSNDTTNTVAFISVYEKTTSATTTINFLYVFLFFFPKFKSLFNHHFRFPNFHFHCCWSFYFWTNWLLSYQSSPFSSELALFYLLGVFLPSANRYENSLTFVNQSNHCA